MRMRFFSFHIAMTGTRESCRAISLIVFVILLQNVSPTEVIATAWLRDPSLELNLPVLACRSKNVGYGEVMWYKDYFLVKRGAARPSDHVLSLTDMVQDPSGAYFDQPLRLQGYYWCETDRMNGSAVHSYLFRMREIHTYAGKMLAAGDSLGDEELELSTRDKLTLKKLIYEQEMQEELFGFLSKPNSCVTDISVLKTGLEIRFYVYSRHLFHPRAPHADELIADKDDLDSILEYLLNFNSSGILEEEDAKIRQRMVDWTELRGIDIEQIELRSTLGCYEDVSVVPADPPREVTWPFAEIGEVVIPRDGCSSKNGLAVTRLCTGSFYTGARWGHPDGICDKPPDKLTSQLLHLYETFGDAAKPVYIEELQNLTKRSEELTVTDLHVVADILTELSEVRDLKMDEMDGVFSVIDRLVETNRSELQAAKSTIKLTTRLLRVISNLLSTASLKMREVLFVKQHILVDTRGTKEEDGRVVGMAILDPSSSSGGRRTPPFRRLLEGGERDFSDKKDTVAYFLLPPELVPDGRETETRSEIQTQVSVVLFREWFLFPRPKGVLLRRNYRLLRSPVMLVEVTGGPAFNVTVRLYFKNEYGKRKIENPVCVSFDPKMEDGEGAWSSEGCEYAGIKDGFHACHCHHLSTFALVLSERPDAESDHQYRLGTAVYVGCVASIVALSFTIVLYLLSKVWRETVDHSVLFWLSVSLLCVIVLLLVGDMKQLAVGCRLVAFLLHYSLLVAAGWLLVQGVVHRLRFANKTDMKEVPHFTIKAGLCCWGVPIIIMIIIWLTKDYKHKEDSCRRALCDLSRWTVIPVAALFAVTLWLNVCAVYAVTCRFRKDYLIGNLGYDESVVKFRVALTIYFFVVMSYLFGFFALHKKSRELRILFSISITLTSYYLTLFFVFQEVSLWEMWAKWKKQRNKKSAGETVKFVAGKEKYTEEPCTY